MRALVIALAATLLPSTAFAQRFYGESPRPGSIEIGAGILWTGGYDAGVASADETRNPSVGSSPVTLFQTSSRLGSAVGFDAQLGLYVTRRLSVEGGFELSRPTLTTRAADDFESTPDAAITEVVTQYLFEGSVVFQVASFANGRGRPFVSGGGGYLRQLDDGSAAVETGAEIHGGAGLRYWFGNGARRFALRIEGRVSSRTHSVDLDGERTRRIVPTAAAGLAYVF